MKICLDKPLPEGSDAADFLESGVNWSEFYKWAKPRALKYPDEMPKEPEVVQPELERVTKENVRPDVKVDVQVSEAEPTPTEQMRTRWKDLGLVLTDNLVPINNLSNAICVIENDGVFVNRLWYDEFHQKYFIQDEDGKVREMDDVDVFKITDYVQRTVGIRRLSDDLIQKAIMVYAKQNRRDEPVEWLESLEWDGKDRIETFFSKYMGATDDEYTRAISKNFFLSMVARITRPGCKADHMVILEGKQGAKKSMAMATLGGKYYAEVHESVMNKDFYMVLHAKFLLEISELDSFSKAEASTIKRIVSAQFDRFRAPYAKLVKDYQRRCIFVGTTNESLYLKDHTGGRRFWPITTKHIDVDAIKEDRDQLFAEALHRIKNGEKWWVVPEEKTKEVQELRRQTDEWEDIIESFLYDKPQVTLKQVALDALHIEPAKLDIGTQRRIGRILTMFYYKKKTKRFGPGNVAKVWERDEPWESTEEPELF